MNRNAMFQAAYRDRKRRAGNQCLGLWVPAELNAAIREVFYDKGADELLRRVKGQCCGENAK